MLAMIAYPDKQKKSQEELDGVFGSSRMPTFKDQDHLPYINATVRELLRWRSAFPLGEPLSNMGVARSVEFPSQKYTTLRPRYVPFPHLFVIGELELAQHFFRTIGMKDSSFPKARCV